MNAYRFPRTLSILALVALFLTAIPFAAAQPLRGSDKIEPALLDTLSAEGQADFVLVMAAQADLSAAPAIADWSARGWYVYDTLRAAARESQAAAQDYMSKRGLAFQSFFAGNELYVYAGDLQAAQDLAGLEGVALVRATRTYYVDPILAAARPAPQAIVDWGIIDTKADQFWATFGVQGDGMVVANIDTGVQWNHPALDQAYKCPTNPTDPACWLDPSNICGGTVCDNNGHGTHTMGSMAADDDPALTYIAGMAPNAQFIMCKGCETNSCSDAALNACADWIVAPGGNPNNRPHVVNNSWGGGGGDPWYEAKVQAWVASGIFPAFSAGNSGSSCSSLGSPGDYQVSFGTAAHDSSRAAASFSSRGPSDYGHDPYTKPNISAPGVDICSCVPTDSWDCTYSGTSMASPHTAGAVALLWSCNAALVGQIDQTFQILQDYADPPPAGNCGAPPDGEGNYTFGYGYLNVLAAGLQNCVSAWGVIHGYVRNAQNAAPIADATVTGYRQGGGAWSDTTDASGYYTITLGAGTYTVTAVHPLFTTAAVTGLDVATDTVVVQDFYLQPRGRLWGYVTDADSGVPLPAMVSADGTTDYTDPATGYYEMYLDAGTYDATAESPDYVSQTVAVNIVAGQDTAQDFALLAQVAVIPEPIHATVELGQTGMAGAQMINHMAVPYAFHFYELQAAPAVLGSGGPDPFGYTYKDSDEPGGARFDWIDATDGTPLGLTDDEEANVTLPFPFTFYGTTSTDLRVGNNGGVLFGATLGDLGATNGDLGTTTSNNLIVPFWDDIDADTGNVYVKTVGTAPYRQFVIEWHDRPHYSNVGSGTFELVLYETTHNIKYQYLDTLFGNASYDYGASATAGIRQQGTNYLQYSYNQPVLVDNLAICFQYPGSPPCDPMDVPWYGTNVVAATVPAGSSFFWFNYFTATSAVGIDQPGDYEATLLILPDGGPGPTKFVDVLLTVLPTAAMGRLQGTVTGNRPGGPLAADILIESGGLTWTVPTDPATGFYSYWLDAGSYNVTAGAVGYLSETVGVQITAQQTTTQDFELALLAPWAVVAPTSLAAALPQGTTATRTVTITNAGLAPLEYRLAERAGDYFPAANSILLMGDDLLAAEWDTYRTALAFAGVTWDEWDLLTQPFPTAGELAPYELLIWTDDNVIDPGDADCQVVADWLVGGGRALLGMGRDLLWDLENGTVGGGEYNLYLLLDTAFLADYAGTGITTLDGVPGDPIGGDFAPPNGLTLAGTLDSNGDYADETVGAPTGLVYGAGGVGTGHAGLTHQDAGNFKTVWLGVNFHDGLTNQDQRNQLMENMLAFLVGLDVPWLSEEPVTGTVQPGDMVPVVVTFDAGAVTELGTYTADLAVQSNDPLAGRQVLPVTMTVLPNGDMGAIAGDVTGLGYCDQESYPLEAALLIAAGGGVTQTVVTDPAGHYAAWVMPGVYTVTASAPDHAGATAVVTVTTAQTTTLDFALRALAPCMDVVPLAYSLTLPVDARFTETLTVANAGAGALSWEVHETDTLPLEWIDVPWVSEVPEAGVVPPDDTLDVAVVFDSGALAAGACYTAGLALVHDDAGWDSPLYIPLTLCVSAVSTVTASFESNAPVCREQPVVFTNTSQNAVTYLWSLGDGITSTLENPTHLYAEASTYTVVLTASNPLDWDVYSAPVEVRPLPEAGFTYEMGGLTVTFTNASANAIAYEWALGDGITSTLENPSHTYAEAGTYTVTLWASGECGTAEASQVLVVTVCDQVEIVTVTTSIQGCAVTFGAVLAGDAPFTYAWDLGAFGTYTTPTPLVDFGATGTYTGTLHVWNCADAGHATRDLSVTVECGGPVHYTIYLPLIVRAGAR